MLEVAVEVARAGAAATPPVAPPPELEPLLRFSKLTGPALDAVRRALADDDFRRRVLDEAPTSRIDPVGLLVLWRPAGWEQAVVRLASAAEVGPGHDHDASQRRLERRLAAAEDARRRAETSVATAAARADDARRELTTERDALRAALDDLQSARSAADDATRRATAAELELADLRADLEAAHRLATELRTAGVDDRRIEPDEVDEVLGQAISELESTWSALDQVRSDTSEALDALRRQRTELAARHRHADAGADRVGPRSRAPVPPPPGLIADAPAAVAALLATPGLVVLVDGYNVTIGRWGADLGITDQRVRLERLASSAAARLGVDVWLVFDGADVAPAPAPPRSLVRVLFSEPGEEADDVVIRLAGELPVDRPVAVVSDDNRVRRGAASAGANLVAVDAFLEAVRPPS